MVKVLYGTKMNAWLGGRMFYQGVCEFENDEEGIRFAEMFHKKYEVIEVEKKPKSKKVK
jgi:hypothetical protein